MPENVQNKICTCKNVKGEKSSERKLRDPMKTGRPSVLLLTRHAFTINPCCEYGEERQVTGNKTITDNLLQEAGVCECVCGVSGTDKHLFLFFFFFSSIKWQWRKVMWETGSFEHLSTTDSHCMNDIVLQEKHNHLITVSPQIRSGQWPLLICLAHQTISWKRFWLKHTSLVYKRIQ